MKKLLCGTLAFCVLSILLVKDYVIQVANEGSGFTAKYLCSGVFVSGFEPEAMMQQAIIPASPVLRFAGYNVDFSLQQVTANMLGYIPRTAIYRPRIGCTLLPISEADWPAPLVKTNSPEASTPSYSQEFDHTDSHMFDAEKIQQALDFAFAENDPAGAKNTKAVLIMYKGQLLSERYAPGILPDTPLLGWSMSKSIINALIGTLVNTGKLTLDQAAPVEEWATDARAGITIRQLLQMTSGLQFQEEYSRNSDVARMLTFERDAGAFAASKMLVHPVGTFWDYSSGTSNILARIIHQISGGTLQSSCDFMQTQLFGPLSISSAHFEPDASGAFVGSSYLNLSTRDWAKLGQLYLQDGIWKNKRLLPENWVAFSRSPTKEDHSGKFGAHFWLNTNGALWPDIPTDSFAMKGYQGQRVIIIPSKDLVIVRLGFTPKPAKAGINKLVRDIISALH